MRNRFVDTAKKRAWSDFRYKTRVDYVREVAHINAVFSEERMLTAELELQHEGDMKDGLYDSGDLDYSERKAVCFVTQIITTEVDKQGLTCTLDVRKDGTIDVRVYKLPVTLGESLLFIRVFLRNFQYSVRGAKDKSVKTTKSLKEILAHIDAGVF